MTYAINRRHRFLAEHDMFDLGMYAFLGILTLGILAAIGIPLFLFISNAINAPSSGTIHDRSFTPAHSGTSCVMIGKVMTCHPVYYADEYEFDLYNNSNGKHGWVEVDATAYNTHKVGDFYNTKG